MAANKVNTHMIMSQNVTTRVERMEAELRLVQNITTRVERMEAELHESRLKQDITTRLESELSELQQLINKLQTQPQLQKALRSNEGGMVYGAGMYYDYIFRIMLIGDSGVGKSNILSRLMTDDLHLKSEPTVVFDFATRNLQVERKMIKVHIWDTSGQEKYKAFMSCYYKGLVGALLVYDITKKPTFDNLKCRWLRELREHNDSNIVILIVGNKSDLNCRRVVSQKEAQSFAEKEGLLYLEVSALDPCSIGKVFLTLVTHIYSNTCKTTLAADEDEDVGIGKGTAIDVGGDAYGNTKRGWCSRWEACFGK